MNNRMTNLISAGNELLSYGYDNYQNYINDDTQLSELMLDLRNKIDSYDNINSAPLYFASKNLISYLIIARPFLTAFSKDSKLDSLEKKFRLEHKNIIL